jgi:hypothetical protein
LNSEQESFQNYEMKTDHLPTHGGPPSTRDNSATLPPP